VDEAPRTLDELLREAAGRIERLSHVEALEAARAGALLVDIRSELARERDGVVPGAIHVPRTVLEWRLEPEGSWRNPHVGHLGRQVIVLCEHGHSSLLAAAMLARLGYTRACDVVGGFEAWRKAELPTRQGPAASAALDEPAGMSGPD
jgi:rhodanese-related sulfurtransferase